MLTRVGINKWMTRRVRWKEDCFNFVKKVTIDSIPRNVLILKGPYIRTLWDWFARRWRVPVEVAEMMLDDAVIDEYVPVTVEDTEIALVKCSKHVYGVYMDYGT